jgi:CubicO group peptidase (beta-lactamase class C family)
VGNDPNSIAARTFRSPALSAAQSREISWRRAEIPAAGGHGNARSVALVQSALVGGGAMGKNRRKLLSDAAARRALEPQVTGTDLVLGVPITFGMGYGHVSPMLPLSPNKNVVFWGGWGGSTIVIDFDAQLAFSYVMNRMEPGALGDPRGMRLGAAVYASLAS